MNKKLRAFLWPFKILGITVVVTIWLSFISVQVIGSLTGLRGDIIEFLEYIVSFTI